MGVRFYKAAGGYPGQAPVDPNATGTGGTAAFDPSTLLANANDTNAINLAQLLMQYGNQSAAATPAVSPEALLAEQSKRAAAQASSYGPDAKYYNEFNPGGLFDVISQFIGGLNGGHGPTIDPGARKINRVPLDSSTAGLTQTAKAMQETLAVPASTQKYDAQIQALLAPLLARLGGSAGASTSAPAAPTATMQSIARHLDQLKAAASSQAAAAPAGTSPTDTGLQSFLSNILAPRNYTQNMGSQPVGGNGVFDTSTLPGGNGGGNGIDLSGVGGILKSIFSKIQGPAPTYNRQVP